MNEWLSEYYKRFDPITLFLLAVVWWNINGKIDDKFNSLNVRINDLDKRLTVIETVLLIENRIPSHVVKGGEHE